MKLTKPGTINNGGTKLHCEKPIICPHCHAFIEPVPAKLAVCSHKNLVVYLVIFQANCCEQLFIGTYKVSGDSTKLELLTIYPSWKPTQLPEAIQKISPRFVELYNQAYFAEMHNHFELAGSGYRNALEVLIKDYAIQELEKPSQEVCKKNLFEAIGEYMSSVSLSTAADVVRVLGNDYTHYERKYEEIDFQVLKQYLKIYINSVETEYLLRHPVVKTNRN